MIIVDARSGELVEVGQTVTYPEGEWWKLVAVDERWFSADAVIVSSHNWRPHRVPLRVRFTHPAFLLQKVGFFPS